MEHQPTPPPQAMPGLWRERGGVDGLVRLNVPAVTRGMVVVAKQVGAWSEDLDAVS